MRLRIFLGSIVLIAAACSGNGEEPLPTLIPTATTVNLPSPVPTLTSIPLPTNTPLPTPTLAEVAEATPEVTEEPLRLLALADLEEAIDPPISLTLPSEWTTLNATYLIQDIDGIRSLPFTVYEGPVTGGTGQIILIWGFPEIGIGGNPLDSGSDVVFSLYNDGLRILRLAVLDPACNIGTDVERNYGVGGLPARGTVFSAVNCPDEPDTRGWFAALQQDGLNFAFYMLGLPIEVMDGDAPLEMQAILDSVAFHVDELLARPTNSP
jgi:hypothetical protein